MSWISLLKNLRRFRSRSEDFLFTAEPPRYVAVIMDGNGRWAAGKRLPAIAGHREGAQALKRSIRACRRAGVKELTVYAFSTENWQRPRSEVEALMDMFTELINKEVPELHEQQVRVRFIGRRAQLSKEIRSRIDWAEELTGGNREMRLFIAFNYGGRAEIVDAAAAAAGAGFTGDEEEFGKFMYAPEMHDPELLIRTSGEQRISNFLLWQCAYSELYFSDKLWPDFDATDLEAAFEEFNRRSRRFGAR